jgi:hypothetical protein
MSSLKALRAVQLAFAVDSKCAGLALYERLISPKLADTNPDCVVDYEVRAYLAFQVPVAVIPVLFHSTESACLLVSKSIIQRSISLVIVLFSS